MAIDIKRHNMCLLVFFMLTVTFWCNGEKMIFKPGFEYQYTFDSTAELVNVGKFLLKAKLGFINIQELEDEQEILLIVHTFSFAPEEDPSIVGHDFDFKKWFSFVMTHRGEIMQVYHPFKEDSEVLAIKKGFAGLLASKIYTEEEIKQKNPSGQLEYSTEEFGHEGPHSANYTVVKTDTGRAFKKVRSKYDHPISNAISSFEKTFHFHDNLETIHSVLVKEDLLIPGSSQSGFDPYYAMRRVKAVNEFNREEFPEIRAITLGELRFLTRARFSNSLLKPLEDLTSGTIQIPAKVRNVRLEKNMTKVFQYVQGNLSCIVKQPEKGSPDYNHCSLELKRTLTHLPTSELEKLADHHFGLKMKQFMSYKAQVEQEAILDALGSLQTNASQMILYKYIFDSDKVDERLVQRLLVHISIMDEVPYQVLINGVKQICKTMYLGKQQLSTKTFNRALLSLGSVARKLDKHGQKDEAKEIAQYLHDMLGLHDPWVYRKKRSTMTEEEAIEYDMFKVTLVGALGNARHDDSYHYIISHMNDTNSPRIKRAAVYALRHYYHQEAAEMLLTVALTDEDENVRYEALLQYQSHPLSRIITPLNARSNGNGSYILDPYKSGIMEVFHPLSKRDILDILNKGLEFRLEAPSVDWQKRLGTDDIGASFGLIMSNLLDLKVALSSGHIKVNVHDEAYARVHLGILGINYNFFTARICFKGGASYKLNILKEFDPKFGLNIVQQFIGQIQKIIDAIKTGVDLFTSLINGELSIQKIVEDFITALKNIPGRVMELGSKIKEVISRLQLLKTDKMPPFVQPVQNLVQYVTDLIEDIQTDAMTFYNTIVETITITIPQSATQIFESAQDIITSFPGIFKDPKTALGNIAKGVINIALSVKRLLTAKDKIMKLIPNKAPEWMDLKKVKDEVSSKTKAALKALQNSGEAWIKEQLNPEEDPIKKFSNGKYSQEDLRREIIGELKSITDDIFNPFNVVKSLGGEFMEQFLKVFGLVKDIKDALDMLKKGYETARSIVDKIFGPKCHKDFPRNIRIGGGGCSKDGSFPGLDQYEHDGVDVDIQEGKDVVAPFPGIAILSNKPNEIKIIKAQDLGDGSVVILTNVAPVEGIQDPNDASYTEFRVGKGDRIGKATKSPCTGMNHIHLAILRDGGAVDPTNFLESKLVEPPVWIQECDDIKFVFKEEVIIDDTIVGLGGRKNESNTAEVPEKGNRPTKIDEDKKPGQDMDKYKSDANSMYRKVKSSSLPSDLTKKDGKTGFGATIGNLLQKAEAFLERFSLRRLKMGQIINLLDLLKMTESREKLAVLLKRVKSLVDLKPCVNPYNMPDKDLHIELMNRGLDAEGSREQLIQRLTTISYSCPLISLSMPETELMYCSLDEQCLGIDCCLTINVFDLLQMTVHAFVRYDPCASQIHMGFSDWEKTFTILEEGFEGTINIGNQLDFLGGLQLLIKFKIQKTVTEVVATVGAGVCKDNNTNNCPVFFNLLNEAVLPFPVCNPDGSITWPKVDFKTYFSKEALQKRLQESSKQIQEKNKGIVTAAILKTLGLPEHLLDQTPPCPKPENMAHATLVAELANRNLSTVGTTEVLKQRLLKADLSCQVNGRILSLPEITDPGWRNLLYYKISNNCIRLDACLNIEISDVNFTKAVSAFLELDPCNFILKVSFETFSTTVILVDYEWGVEKTLDISTDWKVRFIISKDDAAKVFDVDLGLKSPFIEGMFIKGIKIPIPVCNEDFSFGGTSLGVLSLNQVS